MPIYNVENYIYESINSLLSQSFKSFELIIINDGSVDTSLSIAEHFASIDDRIRIISQSNFGPSAARNLGLNHAKGQYIYFFDGDDLLEPNTLSLCAKYIEYFQLDLVAFSGIAFSDSSAIKVPFNSFQKPAIMDMKNGSHLFITLNRMNAYSCQPCLYIFSRKIAQQNKLFFENGYIHEDEAFTALLFCLSQKSIALSDCLFKRRIRENSIMTTPISFKNVAGLVQSAFKINYFLNIKNCFNKETRIALRSRQRCLLRRAIKETEKLGCHTSLISIMRSKFNTLDLIKIDPAAFLFARAYPFYSSLRTAKRYFILHQHTTITEIKR